MLATVLLNSYAALSEAASGAIAHMQPGIITLGRIIGAILCGWALAGVYRKYSEGGGVDGWTIVRPLVLLFCVMFFQSIVYTPTRAVVGILSRDLSKNVSETNDRWLMEVIEESGKTAAKNNTVRAMGWLGLGKSEGDTYSVGTADDAVSVAPAKDKDAPGWLRKVWAFVKGMVVGYVTNIMNRSSIVALGLIGLIAVILKWVLELVTLGQIIMSYLLIAILVSIGPLVFAFAILPDFSNGIGAWFARYVHFSLWVPMLFVVQNVGASISLAFVHSTSNMWVAVIVILANITAVTSVPALCKFVLETSGANEFMQGQSGVAGKAAGVAKTAAKGLLL